LSRPLIIVESPAKARTLERMLARRYRVMASMGHVRDLPKSQFGVDVDNAFQPKYITIRGKGDVLRELRKAARKAKRVYLATDPDREGEAISWHLAQALDLPVAWARIEFHEITKDAVDKALQRPRPLDENLVNAQQARRILDRIVGYKLSPLLWRKIRRGLSAGRVQSATLRLVCDREDEIRAFVPVEYWTLHAKLALPGEGARELTARFWGTAAGKVELAREEDVQKVTAGLEGVEYRVLEVRSRERRRHPAPPFTTSTMQQEAWRKLGFSVKKTMAVAQQLYEGLDLGEEGATGLATYIRTDSTRVADEARAAARECIRTRFGEAFLGERDAAAKTDGAGPGGAHEAIRPTATSRTPEAMKVFLSTDQQKLYRLIWERFMASEMAPALYDLVTVEIQAGAYRFRAGGSTLRSPGFTVLYTEGTDEAETDRTEEQTIPELRESEVLRYLDMDARQHFTSAPARYTEASLVRALEERGIGRPSTYAPIIDTIVHRGYVFKQDRRLVPSELGCLVVDMLKRYFPDILDVAFTAEMEGRLDRVEEGSADWAGVLRGFYEPFLEALKRAEEEIGPVDLPVQATDVPCEKCGRLMVIKEGRFGRFMACPGFPECRFTKPILQAVDAVCPDCRGSMVERRSKKGRRFYGCANYPACSFVTWRRPTGRTCASCGAFLVQQKSRGAEVERCVRDACGYQEPVGSADDEARP
jgi:DNA topoisomerase-1